MGQKDFQQFTIINHMISELNLPVDLVVCRTKREKHGLAMSSRNQRLEPRIREQASIINKTLKAVKRKIKTHNFDDLRNYGIEKMSIPDFKPEYFDIVDGKTLHSLNSYTQSDYIVACTAVWAKNIRLIDNRIMKFPA
jgi:pantoate--beta-alanine ligase